MISPRLEGFVLRGRSNIRLTKVLYVDWGTRRLGDWGDEETGRRGDWGRNSYLVTPLILSNPYQQGLV